MTAARRLLEIELATAFVLSPSGRMLRNGDPDGGTAPKMILAGCGDGNILLLSEDVDARIAAELAALAAQEPPLDTPGAVPRFAERYRMLLARETAPSASDFGLRFLLPNDTAFARPAEVVCHATPEGDALSARFARDGVPRSLIAMGFADLSHLWAPWCIVLDAGEVASIAFAARLGLRGAALGLATMPAFRGHGFGAAATAAWSALPALRHKVLFYGTDRANISSQRVTERLGLGFLGTSLRL